MDKVINMLQGIPNRNEDEINALDLLSTANRLIKKFRESGEKVSFAIMADGTTIKMSINDYYDTPTYDDLDD